MNQDISILFKHLTSVEPNPPLGWSLLWWVGSSQITKNQINLELIEIIQFWTFWTFFLKPLQPFKDYFLNMITFYNIH